MRRSSITLAILWVCACSERPAEVVEHAFSALEKGEIDESRFDGSYLDPLGDKATLLADLRHLYQSTGRIKITLTEVQTVSGQTKREATVLGRLDVELAGKPTWRATGPLDIDLKDDDQFQITSGFLSDLRNVIKLAADRRAALEGNDATLYTKLLHPTYRDGDVDREDTAARIERDLSTATRIRLEPSLYKLEVRGPLAHLDEHYILTVNDRVLPPAIARLTLRPAAGLWRIAAGLYPESSEQR